MALTVSRVTRSTFGNKRVVVADVTFDNSYTTGGLALTATTLGLRKVEAVLGVTAVSSTPTKFDAAYDYTNSKLLAYGTNATPGAAVADVQVTNGTDLSTFTVRLVALGF